VQTQILLQGGLSRFEKYVCGHVVLSLQRATLEFWECYAELPKVVRKKADKNFLLLKANPKHPSLHFKSIGEAWSVRIGLEWRALALPNKNGFDWFWIGSHAEYDKLIS
jgi:hypothetical protein